MLAKNDAVFFLIAALNEAEVIGETYAGWSKSLALRSFSSTMRHRMARDIARTTGGGRCVVVTRALPHARRAKGLPERRIVGAVR